MSVADDKFDYPGLVPEVDSLRLLTMAPGNFADPIVATLTSVAFREKPKYVALSGRCKAPISFHRRGLQSTT
jgi:hypothetical protein